MGGGSCSVWKQLTEVHRGGAALDPVGGSELLLHALLGSLARVGCLNVLVYSDQRLLESIEGGRVQHLLLDLRTVGTPAHEEELLLFAGLGGALALVLVLEVIQSVPAL